MNRLGILYRLERELKILIKVLGAVAILGVIVPFTSAQWPAFATRGVPRTPTGQPDLTAPTPRTPEASRTFPGSGTMAATPISRAVEGVGPRARGADFNTAPPPAAQPLQMQDLQMRPSLMLERDSAKDCPFSPGPQNS